jgi:hypothetical protein
MATITFTGQVGIGSILTFLTALIGFFTVLAEIKRNRRHADKVEEKVDAVSHAVNGVLPGDTSMVRNVQELHDQLTNSAAQRTFDE